MTGKAGKKEMGWVDGKSRNVRQTEKSSNKSNSKFQLIDRPVEGRGKKPEGGSLSLRSAHDVAKTVHPLRIEVDFVSTEVQLCFTQLVKHQFQVFFVLFDRRRVDEYIV